MSAVRAGAGAEQSAGKPRSAAAPTRFLLARDGHRKGASGQEPAHRCLRRRGGSWEAPCASVSLG